MLGKYFGACKSFSVYDIAAVSAPVFSAQLKEATVEAGKPLELTAAINPAAEPVEAVWQKDKKPVDTKAKGVSTSCVKGQCKLKIDSCSTADAGEYSVTVKNPSGSVTSTAKITIKGLAKALGMKNKLKNTNRIVLKFKQDFLI